MRLFQNAEIPPFQGIPLYYPWNARSAFQPGSRIGFLARFPLRIRHWGGDDVHTALGRRGAGGVEIVAVRPLSPAVDINGP